MNYEIPIRSLAFSLTLAMLVLAASSHVLTAEEKSPSNGVNSAIYLVAEINHSAENQPPILVSLQPEKKGPSSAGATVKWSAQAADPDGDVPLFQFWLNGPSTGNAWKAMTNWTEDSMWSWTTTPKDMGNNIIEVRVRDGFHSSPEEWDDKLNAEYQIAAKENQKPAILGLRADKVSPQSEGARIIWTAQASDPDDDTLLYKWWLKGPSTDEVLTPMTDWTTKNQWTWHSSPSATGMYSIEVWVRDGYHAGPEGYDDLKRNSFVIRNFLP